MPHSNDVEYWAHHYVLIDPRIDDPVKSVFYVGRAIGEPYTPLARYGQHLRQAASGSRTYKCNKIRHIQRDGLQPILLELPNCDGDGTVEPSLIASYRANGAKLTNMTEGGEGTIGWMPTDNQRANISKAVRDSPKCVAVRKEIAKKLRDPVFNEKFRDSIRAAHQRPEVKAKRAAVFATDEVKAKRAAAAKAYWQVEAHRERWSNIQKAVWSQPEYRAARASMMATPEYRQIVRRTANLNRREAFRKRARNPEYVICAWLNATGLRAFEIARQTGLKYHKAAYWLKQYRKDVADNNFSVIG